MATMKSEIVRRALLAITILTTVTVVGEGSAFPLSTENKIIEWPLEISGPGDTAVVYQPQPESFKDDQVIPRAAVSTPLKGDKGPVFVAVCNAKQL